MSKLMTVSQAGKKYRKSTQTIYNNINKGLIYKYSTSPIMVSDEHMRVVFGPPEEQTWRTCKPKRRKPALGQTIPVVMERRTVDERGYIFAVAAASTVASVIILTVAKAMGV